MLVKGLWMSGFRCSVTICGPRRSDEPSCSSALPGLKSGINVAQDPPAPQGLPIQILLPCLCCKLSCEPGWPELCHLYLINGIFRVPKHNFPFSYSTLRIWHSPRMYFSTVQTGHKLFQISLFVTAIITVGSLPPSQFFWPEKKIFSHLFPF